MKDFSIRHLENFSDIKAHTIRIWEQRFGIFQPRRSKGNVRHYSLNDVKLLLNVALLLKNGARISELAGTDSASMGNRIKSLTADEARREKVVSQLIICMFSQDIEQFEDILDSCIICWDVDITIRELIIPFLEKVQLLSYHDNSCEAHLAVTAIRKKIILGLERVNPSMVTNKSAILFLPEDEHYDLILLYMAYILKKKGIKVCYLGTNITRDNLELMLKSKKPDYLFTYIPQKQKFKMHTLISFLTNQLPHTRFFVVGSEKKLINDEIRNNVNFIHYGDLELVG
jgi:DNA-binding transcriptional MerR regulator